MKAPTHRDWFGLNGFAPGPELPRNGTQFYLLEAVGSTSDFLLGRGEPATGRLCHWQEWGWQAANVKRQAPPRNPCPGTLAVARHQNRGRGRQGRIWHDCGGLFISWVWPLEFSALQNGLAVWAGLMVVLALRERFGLDVQLKWPNDFLVGGLKLGGLLLDRVGSGSAGYIVAGLGVNLSTEPADFITPLQGRATSLRILLRRTPKPAEVAGPVLAHLGRELPRFTTDGWQNYGSSLAVCDWLRDRTVRIGGVEDISGTALGISNEGALRVRTSEGGMHYLRVGDVHLPEVATNAEDEESTDAGLSH